MPNYTIQLFDTETSTSRHLDNNDRTHTATFGGGKRNSVTTVFSSNINSNAHRSTVKGKCS